MMRVDNDNMLYFWQLFVSFLYVCLPNVEIHPNWRSHVQKKFYRHMERREKDFALCFARDRALRSNSASR